MRSIRFFVSFNIQGDTIEIQDKEIVHQIVRVLRLREGEEVILCDGNMNEVRTWIIGLTKDTVTVQVLERRVNMGEPKCDVILYCALLKRENFEWVAQKTTEVGVKEIVPILTHHTVKLDTKIDRLQKIVKEAAEQSGRGVVPRIGVPVEFKSVFNSIKQNEINLFFDFGGNHIRDVDIARDKKVGIFIGPEGGWSDEERRLAKEHNFICTNLGVLTLRAETAAVVASYLVVSNFS